MTEEYKQYLGDSVYVCVENGMVKLTTENGGTEPGNTIYLEPSIYRALTDWYRTLRQRKDQPNENR